MQPLLSIRTGTLKYTVPTPLLVKLRNRVCGARFCRCNTESNPIFFAHEDDRVHNDILPVAAATAEKTLMESLIEQIILRNQCSNEAC